MHDVRLEGCTPEPLMGYLKALGVFRLVSEQADPAARGWWHEGVFMLRSKLTKEELQDFLLNKYRPTPIVGPWGARSGFYSGASEKTAREALDCIEKSTDPRFDSFRSAIQEVRRLLSDLGFETKPADEEKFRLLRGCRNRLPDDLVPWLDAVFVLTEEEGEYPPILGTGGNEGSGSYTSNFAQILDTLFIRRKADDSLAGALFAEAGAPLADIMVGHFNPGAIGGPNSSQGFDGGGGCNPWDYLLSLEGVASFAGSASRRLGTASTGTTAFPFTVSSVAVGYGSATASEETREGSRAEVWLPLWVTPTSFPEAQQLFREGRAQLGRRQARNAVEFALAVCLLGVGRGIDSFVRYGFLKRNGLSFMAAPLGRVSVPRHAIPLARLLEDSELTVWLHQLRRACSDKDRAPARYQAVLRDIDRTVFEFATRSQIDETADRPALMKVLAAIGRAERTLSLGLRFCEDKNIRPLQRLNLDWLKLADSSDECRAFRLAASLASILAVRGNIPVGPLRVHLEPVEVKRRAEWDAGSTSAVWSNRPLADNLAAMFLRRLMETERAGGEGVALTARLPAQLGDVVAFLEGETDDELLVDLLWAMIGLDWAKPPASLKPSAPSNRPGDLLYAMIALNARGKGAKVLRKRFQGWYEGRDGRYQQRDWTDEDHRRFLFPLPEIPRDFALLRLIAEPVELTAGRRAKPFEAGPESAVSSKAEREFWRASMSPTQSSVPLSRPFQLLGRSSSHAPQFPDEAVDLAAHRLWAKGLTPFGWANRRRRQTKYLAEPRSDAVRLLAACLFPLSRTSLARLANRALARPVPTT